MLYNKDGDITMETVNKTWEWVYNLMDKLREENPGMTFEEAHAIILAEAAKVGIRADFVGGGGQ